MKKTFFLGAMEEPLTIQLRGCLPKERLSVFDRHANAISLLNVHGFLRDVEADKARRRLVSKIQKEITQQTKGEGE